VQRGGEVADGGEAGREGVGVVGGVGDGGSDSVGELGRGPSVVVGDAPGGGFGVQPCADGVEGLRHSVDRDGEAGGEGGDGGGVGDAAVGGGVGEVAGGLGGQVADLGGKGVGVGAVQEAVEGGGELRGRDGAVGGFGHGCGSPPLGVAAPGAFHCGHVLGARAVRSSGAASAGRKN